MGKGYFLQSNFTGGEIDPKLKGRVDSPRYQNGLETCKNAYTMITGGVTRRPGTRFIDSMPPVSYPAITAPTWVGTGAPWSAPDGGGNMTPPLPSGWAVDDVLLVHIVKNDIIACSMPGWTLLTAYNHTNGVLRLECWWKRAGAGEAAPTITNAGTASCASVIHAARGCITFGNPYTAVSVNSGLTSAGDKNMPALDITTAADKSLVCHLLGFNYGNSAGAVFSGASLTWTERFDQGTESGTDRTLLAGTAEKDPAGSVSGAKVVVAASGVPWVNMLFDLKPVVYDYSNVSNRIIPFNALKKDSTPPVFQGYIIEFRGNGTVHFYTNGAVILSGGSPYSLAHPFTNADLKKIRYAQFNNVLYLVHPDFPPQQLTRTSDTSWAFAAVPFTMPAAATQAIKSVSGITRSGSTATATSASHGYVTGQFVRIAGAAQAEYNGDFQITVVDVNSFTYTVTGTPATPATGTITAQGIIGITRTDSTATVTMPAPHGYQTNQIINISGAGQTEYNGDFQITVTGTATFTCTVSGSPATPATGTIAAKRIYWGTTGYPQAITFFEQRLILGGAKTHPYTVWGSENGNITNMVTGTGDSDPFEFALSAVSSHIVHLSAIKQILVSTGDKELSIQGGVEKPLTPTNVQIKEHTIYGCREKVRPLTIGGELLFATKHGKKLRALGYRIESDAYTAPDLSIVSGHLAELGIEEMAFQPEPVSIVWIVTTDGNLLSITFDRDQDVIAWAKHTTDGLFKAVAVIPYGDADQVWVVVERTIGGTAYACVEIFDPTLDTDSAITGTDGPGKATWTGLSHLDGKTVDILADGIVMPSQVVSGGQLTLPRNANAVEIGLHYETAIQDLPPEIPTQMGTAQGQAVSVNRAIVRLHNSTGCEINGDVIPFRKFGEGILDQDVDPFTGDKSANLIGWDKKGIVTIKQTQPLPFTVLAVVKELTVNG